MKLYNRPIERPRSSVPSSSPEQIHQLSSSTRKRPPPRPTRPTSPVQQPLEQYEQRSITQAADAVEQDFLEDDISKSYVRESAAPLSSPLSSLPGSPLLPRLSPSPSRARPSPPRFQSTPPRLRSATLEIVENEDDLSRRTALRLERSLRPRKPIQQHPYLLENAQYATFMKSHGVKPIKVVQASQSAGRQEEEDSQEKEFIAEEESQETPVLFDNSDVDELAPSPTLPKTSPAHNLRTSSQRSHGGSQTDNTSMSDGEDFPDLDKLKPLAVKKRSRTLKGLKRPPSTQQLSSTQKRRRVIPSSSPPADVHVPPSIPRSLQSSPLVREVSREDLLENTRRSPIRRLAKTPSVGFWDNGNTYSPVAIEDDDGSGLSGAESHSSGQSSGSESEVVREQSRRIRGVLPASWLRLNQPPTNKPAPARQSRQSPERSPEPATIRKGVALPRPGTQRPPTSTAFLFDESEDSDEPSRAQSASNSLPPSTAPPAAILIEDDGSSGMEDDHVDWMLPGQKRSSRSKSTTAAGSRPMGTTKRRRSATQSRRKRAATPPLLSILDVMEDDAPKFIKIAARTARKTKTMGKTSPSRKAIRLANRTDNVDVLSTLRDWKSGKTKPKVALELSKRSTQPKKRPVLREVSTNVSSRSHLAAPRRTSGISGDPQQSNLDGFVEVLEDENSEPPQLPQLPQLPQPRKLSVRKPGVQGRGPVMRPAQLEEDEGEDKRRQLNARKRRLDAFYRRAQQLLDLPAIDEPRNRVDIDFNRQKGPAQQIHDQQSKFPEDSSAQATQGPKAVRPRYKKTRRPQHVNLEAPQYARANDPLPADIFLVNVEDHNPDQPQDKLQGLGPYGTIYTQHFDIFPLDVGVFFHESTVIGRGFIQKAMETSFAERIRHQKASVSWTLDQGAVFRWSVWDDKTSSELGILVDWVSDQLSAEAENPIDARKPIEAADFILRYILNSLSIPDDLGEKAFVARCLEVFSSFIARFDSLEWKDMSAETNMKRLEVISRFNIVMLAVRSVSQAGSNPIETMTVEDTVTKLGRATIKRLLGSGLDELRELYGDLQQASFRERGIRPDRVLVNCWAVVVRVLQSTNIPRSSFWDVAQSVMLSDGIAAGLDAQAFERLWRDMFTLLPLGELDNSGILIAGLRKTAPMEGWTLPQKLLKRVFELYRGHSRQPASFNEYCRALVARCHFLVQQWGWRKYTGIIGTIFDFFGSQNLANLRNEEVYKSPKFLEELGGKPSLFIEPEDRCFHIFLKMLALAIQRLRELGRMNDIKNLVARTLPNHNRQYHKEDTIHQHDLAALRNHHDLLCTLFWVAPPDLRPAVHLIEKLVVPASAHKEACLISIRAWSQLARFVISNGEGVDVFRPFAVWRNNIFNQVLDQYLSAASDIEQQFRALPNQGHGISKEMRDDMIAKNKASALDVLALSIKTSLAVLQRAPTLEAAMYGLNTTQLQKVFTSLDFHSHKFDWSILNVALDSLDNFIARIDQASEEQYSSDFLNTQAFDSRALEEAILLVNEQLARDFFWMARTVISLAIPNSLLRQNPQTLCVEKTVALAARLAARFIKDRLTKLSSYFTPGKYFLFSALPKDLVTSERTYLPLFLAILLKNQIFDFKDIGTTLLGLWTLAITKPFALLRYENYLADVLKSQNLPFMQDATAVCSGIEPDYNSNHDFFLSCLLYMRKALRPSNSSGSSTSKKLLREEFSSTLCLVMTRLKSDLSLHPSPNFLQFVRSVVLCIKSHGTGICTVDPFFLQPSATYSPPMHDIKLHEAGILAYGVRLGEKDGSAGPQLWWYLWNSWRLSFGNGKLGDEKKVVRGVMMKDKEVREFVIGRLVAGVVLAVTKERKGWVLLEWWGGELGVEECYLLALMMDLVGLVWGGLVVWVGNNEDNVVEGLEGTVRRLQEAVKNVRRFVEGCDGVVSGENEGDEMAAGPGITIPPEIQGYARTIATDVEKNWRVDDQGGSVYIRMARVTPAGTQSGNGNGESRMEASVNFTPWNREELMERLKALFGRWDRRILLFSEQEQGFRSKSSRSGKRIWQAGGSGDGEKDMELIF
ncbi:protein mms22 [Cladorrhinum samala]|uniref:Protein mms22 n=1 Tax=Cladorrhinum samala TaxID=585594 RepID=A0AAV9HZ11_9PEZI|nr:protein mms22 [Cladorrhinum samala]